MKFWQWTGFSSKTLFDWIEVVAVPTGVAVGTLIATVGLGYVQNEISKDNQRSTLLLDYYERMQGLLLDKDMPKPSTSEPAASMANALTLTTFRQLDGARKGELLKFLYQAGLIKVDSRCQKSSKEKAKQSVCKDSIIDLEGARLEGTSLADGIVLEGVDLAKASLKGANLPRIQLTNAKMNGIILDDAIITDALLNNANMENAKLNNATLNNSNLYKAKLSYARLEVAKLRDAVLIETDFTCADLRGADLTGAKLKGAIFEKARYDSKTRIPESNKAKMSQKDECDGKK